MKGDSLIYTPSGTIPFNKFPGGTVLAVNRQGEVVAAHADTPVNLGKSPMVRVTMSDGTFFECTFDHSFKTTEGWTTVASLIRNHWCVPTGSAYLEESILGIDQKGLPEDVRNYLQTTLGCQGDCSACCHQCGERLQSVSGTDQVSPPSQDGANVHNHSHKDFHQDFSVFDALKMDDAPPIEGHIRLYRFYPRDGQCGNTPQSVVLGEEGYTVVHNAEAIFVESPVFEIPHDCIYPQNTVDESQNLSDDKPCHVPDGQDPQSLLSRSSFDYLHIKSIDFIGGYVKYDMTVATEHNYIANGYIHHNCGKTRSLVMFTLMLVEKLQGVKDDGGSYAKILVGGYTYAHLEQTYMIDLNSYLDQSKTSYRYDTKNHIMYIGTVQIIFVQLSEPDRIFGQSVYAALLDEADELPEDIMIEAMKSVSQRCRQKLKGQRSCFIVAASTAQGYKGFYRLYTHYKKQKIGFVLTRALTRDNIYLPKEYIEDLEKSFTETERKVYMEGEFLSVSQGRVIPGFDWERNFEDDDMDLKLPPNAKVYIGQDFNTGYSRASAWVSDPVTGTAHCIKYYDFQDVMEAPNIFRFDFPTQDIYWIPDVTSKDSFPQFAKALRQHNIHIIYRSKSPMVEDSCFLLSSLCYQGKLIVHTQASAIAEAFAQASRDKNNKIPKGVGENSPIHAIDGARYAVSYMALVLPEYRDIRRSLMTHLPTYRNIIENNKEEDEEVKQVGSGYMQIEGSAYLH